MKYDTLLMFATKRSGHHAILNWICEQSEVSCVHHNDTNIDELIKGNIVYNGNTKIKNYNKGTEKTVEVFNFENGSIDKLQSLLESDMFKDKNVGVSIVLRDFYNTIASTIKSTHPTSMNKTLNEQYTNWVSYATIDDEAINNFVYVNYNMWFTENGYRSIISESFGVPFTDAGFKTVPNFAGGSSFDRLGYNNNANQMSVLERYKAYENDPLFIEQTKLAGVADLSEKLFGLSL